MYASSSEAVTKVRRLILIVDSCSGFQKRTGESRRHANYSTTMSLPDTDTVPHHCKIAGRADTLFSDDAIALIHNASRGHPRAVNNLALHALTAAFATDHAIVDEKAARVSISENAAD